jgi:hypothetical protein
MITLSEIDVTQGFGDGFMVLPSQLASTNTSSLQHIVNKLLTLAGSSNGSGGTLIFPSIGITSGTMPAPSYNFSGSITIGHDSTGTTRPFSIVIKGDGQQQEGAPLLVQTTANDLFIINTNDGTDDDDVGGTVFQDLMMTYAGPTPQTGVPPPAAVHVTNKSESVRLNRTSLINWPAAVWLDESYRASIIDTTIHVLGSVTYSTIGLYVGNVNNGDAGVETYVTGCLFLDKSNRGTAVQVYGCEHLRVMNVRIQGWLQGIAITPTSATENARYLYFSNVSCYPYQASSMLTGGPAVAITTSGSATEATYVFHVTFVGCELSAPEPTMENPLTKYQGAGVVIGSTGVGALDAIDQIRFVDCHVCRWRGPGLQIVGGSGATTATPTNVEVLGGYYSLNGASPATGLQSAGIVITAGSNGPLGMRVTGAACNNSLFNTETPHVFAASTQQYGIYVTGPAQSIRINGCDFTGNLTSGAHVDGTNGAPVNVFIKDCDFTGPVSALQVVTPVSNLQVTECPGYNDKGKLIATAILLGTAFTIAQLGTVPYYGPGECYVNGAGGTGGVKINAQLTHLTQGSFYLQPSETIEIDSTITNFLAIGK